MGHPVCVTAGDLKLTACLCLVVLFPSITFSTFIQMNPVSDRFQVGF